MTARQFHESCPNLAVVEAAVPLIVEFLVPPAWERKQRLSVRGERSGGGARVSVVVAV